MKKFNLRMKNMAEFENIDFGRYSYDFDAKIAKLQQIRHQYRIGVVRDDAQRGAIVAGLKDLYPQLENDALVKLSYAVVLLPKDKNIKVNEQKVKIADLQFMTAESIENISSGTNSRQEYFSWFEDCAEIMTKMNDGYISDLDLEQRNAWIDHSYVREAEIMVCLALYKNSSYYLAEERYTMLYNKLVKLRQIRSAIIEATRPVSDEKKEKELKNSYRAKVDKYLRNMSLFAKNSIMWNLSKNELIKLGIYHGDDFDLAQEYAYFYSLYEPQKNIKELPAHTVRTASLAELSPVEELAVLPAHENNVLPVHKNAALPEKSEEIFALPPHEQYDFYADLKFNFMQSLNRQYLSGQSNAEEMRLAFRHESRKQVEEKILALREEKQENNGGGRKIFNAQRYRELLKNSNML